MTKPPYNCDNTGREDCTEALRRAVDDPQALITFEIRKEEIVKVCEKIWGDKEQLLCEGPINIVLLGDFRLI